MSTVSSRVLDIYAAIASKTVTIASTSEVIAAWNLSAARDAVEAANTPIRMLMPFESTSSSGQRENGRPIGIAPLYKTTWSVTELMLYRPSSSGLGIVSYASVLTEYCGAYLGLIANIRAPVAAGSIILESWSCQPNMVQYPQESSNWYYGAVCTLTFTENVVLQG